MRFHILIRFVSGVAFSKIRVTVFTEKNFQDVWDIMRFPGLPGCADYISIKAKNHPQLKLVAILLLCFKQSNDISVYLYSVYASYEQINLKRNNFIIQWIQLITFFIIR